ncbi:MAG: hypothetical protein LBC97_15975 [Bifidobacteriaceae bacterium]|nr:hypothetical protein [Bifidobacteriaceae bacterium]
MIRYAPANQTVIHQSPRTRAGADGVSAPVRPGGVVGTGGAGGAAEVIPVAP